MAAPVAVAMENRRVQAVDRALPAVVVAACRLVSPHVVLDQQVVQVICDQEDGGRDVDRLLAGLRGAGGGW